MPTLTPTPPTAIWPTPTFGIQATPALSFLQQIQPTAVEFYARSAEYGVASFNQVTQDSTAVDPILFGVMLLLVVLGFIALFRQLRGSTKND